MHVILLNIAFPEYTIQLANALAKHNISVTVVSSKGHSEERLDRQWKQLLDKNVQLKLLNYGKGKSLKNLCRIAWSAYHLARYIRKNKPDIIHVQESGDPVVVLALSFIKRIMVVATIHDIKAHPGREALFREFFRNRIVRKSCSIIVHGNILKQLAITSFGLKEECIYVIPHGAFSLLQSHYLPETNVLQKEKSILFFGYMYKYKGLQYLVEAEPLISTAIPEVKIIIAGTGPDFKNYEHIVKQKCVFECHDHFLTNEEVIDLFRRTSIVVLPYIEASQSGIIPLAYTFGKPVIATKVGSIPEIVDDGKTGILIPPKDSRALAQAIIQLLSNDKTRTEMGSNAFFKSKTTLSWDNIAAQTLHVYKIVMDTK